MNLFKKSNGEYWMELTFSQAKLNRGAMIMFAQKKASLCFLEFGVGKQSRTASDKEEQFTENV